MFRRDHPAKPAVEPEPPAEAPHGKGRPTPKRREAEAALVRAHVLITARPKQGAAIEAALRRIAEVRTLHSVSGPFDLIAVLAADSIGALDRLIDRIGELEGVERTTSAIVLSTRIAR